MAPQSGRRLSPWCLTTPCLTSCAGVMGWKTAALGSHSVPSSLTTTTTLHSGTALSTNTYFPVSENTWANLRGEINLWLRGVTFKECLHIMTTKGPTCSLHSTLPCWIEVGLLHEYLQTPKGTKVPAGVAIKQVILLVHWEVTPAAISEKKILREITKQIINHNMKTKCKISEYQCGWWWGGKWACRQMTNRRWGWGFEEGQPGQHHYLCLSSFLVDLGSLLVQSSVTSVSQIIDTKLNFKCSKLVRDVRNVLICSVCHLKKTEWQGLTVLESSQTLLLGQTGSNKFSQYSLHGYQVPERLLEPGRETLLPMLRHTVFIIVLTSLLYTFKLFFHG